MRYKAELENEVSEVVKSIRKVKKENKDDLYAVGYYQGMRRALEWVLETRGTRYYSIADDLFPIAK